MNNRFGFKDLVLMLLIVAAIVIMLLKMKQDDRLWTRLNEVATDTGSKLSAQSDQIQQMQRTLRRGVALATPATSSSTTQPSSALPDPFFRVREAQQMSGYDQGDWLIDNFAAKIAKLTPFIAHDLYSTIVLARIVESLAYYDPQTLDYIPLLAKSWQTSPDGLTFTFQLREGVTFSDGQPFTADDVIFTYEWIMNPDVAAPRQRAYYERISSVKKINSHEVVFQFKEPYFESFSLAATMDILPKHFYQRFTSAQYNASTGLVMGTGPYRMKDPTAWHPGERIELLRNERYWGEPAPFDKLIWYEIEVDSAAMTMFKNGEIDMFAATPEQYRELLKDPQLLARTQRFEYLPAVTRYSYVGWNQKRKGAPTPFADKRVRQAMALLCDRQRLVNDLLLGYGQVASGPFSPLGKQTNPDIKPWPFDPQRGMALLKEAGYDDRNGDGVLEGPDGKPFRFTLTYAGKSPLSERLALFLRDSFAKARIIMDLDPADWPIMQRKMTDRDFDAITAAWGGSIEGDLYQIFHSSQIKDNGDNFIAYTNPQLDKAVDLARACVDEQKRMPLWQDAHRILHEDQPYMFLFNAKALVFVDNRFQNVKRSRLGLNYAPRYVGPIPWFVPKQMQKRSR